MRTLNDLLVIWKGQSDKLWEDNRISEATWIDACIKDLRGWLENDFQAMVMDWKEQAAVIDGMLESKGIGHE